LKETNKTNKTDFSILKNVFEEVLTLSYVLE